MKIGELARLAETPTTTIRYYESVGLLKPPARRSGRRVYGREALPQLQAIAALQTAGFTLAEIRELVPTLASPRAPSARWEQAARAKLRELNAKIAELRRAHEMLARAIDCACDGDPAACELVARARAMPSQKRKRTGRPRVFGAV